ncbi:MAG: serine/threonine protein kinase [Labilithrix sp.]|nr:serine/threonine protein kinase [Labilithrix sp.]
MSDGAAATQAKSGGQPDPLIGRVIADRFRITDLIARGGMGKVYRAEQSPLGRLCAVKILNPNYNGDADPEFHRRFFREASITSQISHPNSVTIFDYGKTDDDVYYMAMEYLEGQTLHHALREAKTFHEERVGRIAQQICRALREAHALEVIHRDLKPANIFLTRHGDDEDFVKVLDFGLVKHLTERPEEQLTQTGLFMGSPKYMAPEQIQGGHVDARTDVYSLGIMMYEMLTGKVPFERPTSVNILMAHVGEPPPAMREVNPNLVCSPAFEELVMRCIAKDPQERWGTMDEVLQAIKRAHNVSMTGQLAAVNISGAYQPLPTSPPPPVRASAPAPAANSSASHTPMGVLRPDSGEIGLLDSQGIYGPAPAPRSKAWIGLGVLVAAVLGGVLGMVAFRVTSGGGSTLTVTPASAVVPVAEPLPAPSAAAATTTTTATAGPPTATVKLTSDPPGASVREDASELCAATPCDVTFKGEAADPGKTHKLVFSKAGFKPETKTMKAHDPPVHVKLTAVRGAAVPVTGGRPPAQPKPTGEAPATPNGFKDIPY